MSKPTLKQLQDQLVSLAQSHTQLNAMVIAQEERISELAGGNKPKEGEARIEYGYDRYTLWVFKGGTWEIETDYLLFLWQAKRQWRKLWGQTKGEPTFYPNWRPY